jgi:hypothetical protein
MLGRAVPLAIVLALGPFACSSASPSGTSGAGSGSPGGKNEAGATGEGQGDDGSATGVGEDGAVSGSSPSDGSSTGNASNGSADGAQPKSGDGGTSVSGDAGGGIAAGDAGVVRFCTQACNRAESCAAMVDGGSVEVTTCMTDCTSMNEAGPPKGGDIVLYRSDYVVDLTSCIATADCTDTLGDKAANGCQTSLASSFAPSAAVVTLCQKLEASPCAQDVTPDCLTSFLPYSDATIQAITTCVEDPTCTNHDACVLKALTP